MSPLKRRDNFMCDFGWESRFFMGGRPCNAIRFMPFRPLGAMATPFPVGMRQVPALECIFIKYLSRKSICRLTDCPSRPSVSVSVSVHLPISAYFSGLPLISGIWNREHSLPPIYPIPSPPRTQLELNKMTFQIICDTAGGGLGARNTGTWWCQKCLSMGKC